MKDRTLVIVHVFYPELWDELARCIRNVGDSFDLIVTHSDDRCVAGVRADFPQARLLPCENIGYDIWPFICAVRSVDLSRYDLVVKLHTKRSFPVLPRDRWESYYTSFLSGDRWRTKLLSFVSDRSHWERTLATFDRPSVGCVANPVLVIGRRILGHDDLGFPRAASQAKDLWHVDCRAGKYVSGTMFAARASALTFLKDKAFDLEHFREDGLDHREGFAHLCERLIGLGIGAQGLRVVGYDGGFREEMSFRLRVFLFAVGRFFYRRKVRADGSWTLKILKIPVLSVRRANRDSVEKRKSRYADYGASNYLQYRICKFRRRFDEHWSPRLLLARIRRKRFSQVIPLGINCEVAFRFYRKWGFLDSSLFAWAQTFSIAVIDSALQDLDGILSGDVTLRPSGMWKCEKKGVVFHGQLNWSSRQSYTEREIADDLADLRGRVVHLKDKLLKYLRNEKDTLIVHRLSAEDEASADLGVRLGRLESALNSLGSRNLTYLYICEIPHLRNMPAGPRRHFRAVSAFNPKNRITDLRVGDSAGWAAIFTEFAPRTILPKRHAFKFE